MLRHLRAVNCWNDVEIRLSLENAELRFAWRRKYEWDLDLSLMTGQIRIEGHPRLVIPAKDRARLGNFFYKR